MWAVGRELIILIVEDEAVSRESRMLEEVTRDSEDKRPGEEDRESGRRAHNFYLPNGSKVLVGSYTHLRRDMFIVQHPHQSLHFQKIPGDLNINIF